jgi:class 3 adenylate cyclase/tetratricopeptide (TPR) repeat protein
MNFCGGCGASLTGLCRACGSQNPKGFRYCGACGSRLEAVEAPGPPPDTPGGDEDDAERRQLTVMLCDLVDSTELSERLDPEDLRDIVRRYQRALGEVVTAFEGHVAQYLGDGVLVYFGFPVAHEDDARRAALASVEIMAAIARLDTALDVPLQLRIGLHTGPVVAGDVGARGRTERLAMGQAPNIAARVQALAAPGEVLLTESTWALVGDAVATEAIGPRKLRGVAAPMTLYRIALGKHRLAPRESREPSPFVGRDRELRSLLELLERSEAGRGQVALIKGEPGIGKTRLLQELRKSVSGRDLSWLVGRCSPLHQNSALRPIAELLTAELGLEEGLDAEAMRAQLGAALRDLDVDAGDSFDLLANALSVPTARGSLAAMSPELRRRKTLEVLVELILRMSARRTLVLAIEDCHWADPSTLGLLGLLVKRSAERRILAIFTHRPSFIEGWESPGHQTQIELRRLSDRDVGTIIDAYAGGLPAAVRAALIARTDGVPLFVEELRRALLDRQSAGDSASGVGRDESLTALIPSTLRDLLMARLDALGAAKETAQMGAVLGRQFSLGELSAVSDLTAPALAEQLDRLVNAGILTFSAEVPLYTFTHALVQEVAYDSLLRRRRLKLHDRAARVLEAAKVGETDPQRLAHHYEGAGRWSEASDLYYRAATRASSTWAYAEAIAILEKSLQLLSRTPESREREKAEFKLLTAVTQPMTAHYGYTSAELLHVYERMRTLARRLGPESGSIDVLFRFWAFYCTRGERAETIQLADEIQRFVAQTPVSALLALAGFVSGTTKYYLGDRTGALSCLDVAVTHFEVIREQPNLAGIGDALFLARLVHSVASCDAGRIDEGWASITRAVAFAEARGDPFRVLQALDYQIWAALNVGLDLADIAKIAERAEVLRADYEIGWWNSAAIHVGNARVARGDSAAIVDMRDTVEATRSKGSGIRLGLEVTLLGRALLALGRLDEARDCLDEGLELSHTTLAGFAEPEQHCLLGELAWAEGDLEKAESLLAKSMQVAEQQGAPLFELRAALVTARLLDHQRRGPEARLLLERALARIQSGSDTPYVVAAASLLRALPAAEVTRA